MRLKKRFKRLKNAGQRLKITKEQEINVVCEQVKIKDFSASVLISFLLKISKSIVVPRKRL